MKRLLRAVPGLRAKALGLVQRLSRLEAEISDLRATVVAQHARDFNGTPAAGQDVQAMLIRAAHVSAELHRLGVLYDSLALRIAKQEAATRNARPAPAVQARGDVIAEWHALEREWMLATGLVARVRGLLGGQRRRDVQERMSVLVRRLAIQCELNALAIEGLRAECDELRAMTKWQPSRWGDQQKTGQCI